MFACVGKSETRLCIMGRAIICTLHGSSSRVIKRRRVRWEGHVSRMGEQRNMYGVLVGKPEGKEYLEDVSVDGKIITRQSPKIWKILIHVPSSQTCRTVNTNK